MSNTKRLDLHQIGQLIGLGVVFVVASVMAGCSSTKMIESKETPSALVVDGVIEDWNGELTPFKQEAISLGISNDDEYLNIALMTMDQAAIRQILGRGLVFWLDSAGEKKQDIGIKYPIGMIESGLQRPRGGRGEQRQSGEEMFAMANKLFQQAQLITGEGESMMIARRGEQALKIAGEYTYGMLSLEIQIPLEDANADLLGLSMAPGSEIMLGLQVPEIDREQLREQMAAMGRGQQGGGRGGRGGGGGGMGRGGRGGDGAPGGGRPAPAEPIEIWRKVMLVE